MTPEIIEKVHDMILNDRRVEVWTFFEAIGISQDTVITKNTYNAAYINHVVCAGGSEFKADDFTLS